MPISLNNFPEFRPYSNVQPFTVRDGATYLLQLEALKDWIRDYVIPHLNKEVTELAETWVAQVEALISNWETLSTALIAQVNEAVQGVEEDVAAAEAAKVASEAARDMAAMYASTVQAFQDTAVTNIFNDVNSNFRNAFNAVLVDAIIEDPTDEGTFIISTSGPVQPFNVMADPSDPGFWIEEEA